MATHPDQASVRHSKSKHEAIARELPQSSGCGACSNCVTGIHVGNTGRDPESIGRGQQPRSGRNWFTPEQLGHPHRVDTGFLDTTSERDKILSGQPVRIEHHTDSHHSLPSSHRRSGAGSRSLIERTVLDTADSGCRSNGANKPLHGKLQELVDQVDGALRP